MSDMTEQLSFHALKGASQVMLVVKKTLAYTGDVREGSSVLGLGRSPGGGHGNPLLYPCLENPMDRGAWWATVHGVTKSIKCVANTLFFQFMVFFLFYLYSIF